MSRIRGREKPVGYPQTEGMLGDCMLHYGQELGAASEFGTVENGCMFACLMLFCGSFITVLCFASSSSGCSTGWSSGSSRIGLFPGWSFASPPFFVFWCFFCLFLWHVHLLRPIVDLLVHPLVGTLAYPPHLPLVGPLDSPLFGPTTTTVHPLIGPLAPPTPLLVAPIFDPLVHPLVGPPLCPFSCPHPSLIGPRVDQAVLCLKWVKLCIKWLWPETNWTPTSNTPSSIPCRTSTTWS